MVRLNDPKRKVTKSEKAVDNQKLILRMALVHTALTGVGETNALSPGNLSHSQILTTLNNEQPVIPLLLSAAAQHSG